MDGSQPVVIRPYRDTDAEGTHRCFRAAIIGTASADYDADQIAAWAGPSTGSGIGETGSGIGETGSGISGKGPEPVEGSRGSTSSGPSTSSGIGETGSGISENDLERWAARRQAAHTFVAEIDGTIAGFADFRDDGVLDMLFVRPEYAGRGIARQLVETVLREATAAGHTTLITYASRTARPAFEHFGFTVITEQPNTTVRGVVVPNFKMAWDQSGS